jgi:ribonuclease HI
MMIVVYTDGALKNTGKGGVGIHFPDHKHLDIALPSKECNIKTVTSIRMELYAIMKALETIKEEFEDGQDILIYSDSNYSVQCITAWYVKWERNNFKTSKDEDVKNIDLICPIYDMFCDFNKKGSCRIQHIKGHAGIVGNEEADRLANLGANMDDVKEKNGNLRTFNA